MKHHVVICGFGRVGWRILDYLHAAGLPVVVIDEHASPEDPRLGNAMLVVGDFRKPKVLREAGIDAARGVIIVTSDDHTNLSAALTVRSLRSDVRIVVRLFNQNLLQGLSKTIPNVAGLSTSSLAAPLLAMTAISGHSLGGFTLDDQAQSRRQVVELLLRPGSPWIGKSVGSLTEPRKLVALAHFPCKEEPRHLLQVNSTSILAAGDRLVLCGDPASLAPLMSHGHENAEIHLRMAGWLRRSTRVVWRALREVDRAVLICTGILLGTIVVSTIVFKFGMPRFALSAAVFRTISLMATGADMHERDYVADWERIYVSGLRIVGAALWAAFTAIMTNYLIRARLSGALDVRRIPESGHVVVCGLGALGYRTVQELVRSGVKVLAIEQDPGNRFVATARRLGAAVLNGDTTVREVLRQAHALSARAVVACTHSDLTNLEVALLLRGMNERIRVIPCLTDGQLAEVLRAATSVDQAVSVPNLAAPAFVAALLGDRVQAMLLLDRKPFVVVQLHIEQEDRFLCGQLLRVAAVDYNFLPVAVLGSQGEAQSAGSRLKADDRLVAVIALEDLDRLIRRHPIPAECSVEVTAIPIPALPVVVRLLGLFQKRTVEPTPALLEELPLVIGSQLTRGQAEDLLGLLKRERVAARLIGPT